MVRSERVTVKLTDDEKERWEEYCEESMEVRSLSDLVRLSVSLFMADEDNESVDEQQVRRIMMDIASDHTEDINKNIEDVEMRLKALSSDVQDIQRDSCAAGGIYSGGEDE